jgi:hypothetical protein
MLEIEKITALFAPGLLIATFRRVPPAHCGAFAMSGAPLAAMNAAHKTRFTGQCQMLAAKAMRAHGRTRLKCAKRSLEDIPESLHRYDFCDFICIARLGSSERVNNLYWQMISDCSYRYKLPSLTPGLVQKNDKFRRVQMTCKYFVFPLLHRTSMA